MKDNLRSNDSAAGLKASTSLCPLPWIHLVVKENSYNICCRFQEAHQELAGKNLGEVLRGERLENIRAKMEAGEKLAGCRRCYDSEAASGESMRTQFISQFPDAAEQPPRLRYLEYNVGNLCNLKCRSCSSQYSSRWAGDEKALGITPSPRMPPQVDLLNPMDESLDTLEQIKFIGGEPLLHPIHEKIILSLEARGIIPQLMLDYATNGTIRVSNEVIRAWRKLRALEINFSIDDIKEKNDFFRDGSEWRNLIANIHWFQEQLAGTAATFNIHTVVNIYNVHDIVALDDWLLAEFPDIWLTKDCIITPAWLDIANLPDEEKRTLARYFEEQALIHAKSRKRKNSYQNIARRLRRDRELLFTDFVKRDAQLNSLRGQDLAAVNPRIAALFPG